jgi:hypothetical protein
LSPNLRVIHLGSEARPSVTFAQAYHSVGAGIRPGVGHVIRAIEAVVVDAAADETTPSSAKVFVANVRRATRARAVDASCAETSNATAAKATHLSATKATNAASAKAADVASTKAAHVASTAAAATTTMSATATAASGLCARGNQTPGQ